MTQTVTYLFDPLCGWCYGAAPVLGALAQQPGIRVELLPTGLFAGDGARAMDNEFAAYAWSNDQRIERLTGQPFSETYRTRVLADRTQPFDSGPATLALTAVALTEPAREIEALKALQHARYVGGQNTTDLSSLAALLAHHGFAAAAERLAHPDSDLLDACQASVERARALMRKFGAQGVPAFVADENGNARMLDASAAFSNPVAFVRELSR